MYALVLQHSVVFVTFSFCIDHVDFRPCLVLLKIFKNLDTETRSENRKEAYTKGEILLMGIFLVAL